MQLVFRPNYEEMRQQICVKTMKIIKDTEKDSKGKSEIRMSEET